jgi:hypothetical protein
MHPVDDFIDFHGTSTGKKYFPLFSAIIFCEFIFGGFGLLINVIII